jgi:hypothetical protein
MDRSYILGHPVCTIAETITRWGGGVDTVQTFRRYGTTYFNKKELSALINKCSNYSCYYLWSKFSLHEQKHQNIWSGSMTPLTIKPLKAERTFETARAISVEPALECIQGQNKLGKAWGRPVLMLPLDFEFVNATFWYLLRSTQWVPCVQRLRLLLFRS